MTFAPLLKLSLQLIASVDREVDRIDLDTLWSGGVGIGPFASSRHRHAAQVLESGYECGLLAKSFAGTYSLTAAGRAAAQA